MNVTPTKKKFGKYRPGDEFVLPDRTAKAFIKIGVLREVAAPALTVVPAIVASGPAYQTRAMQAESAPAPIHAPYGFKADGTPRLRPAPPRKQVSE